MKTILCYGVLLPLFIFYNHISILYIRQALYHAIKPDDAKIKEQLGKRSSAIDCQYIEIKFGA